MRTLVVALSLALFGTRVTAQFPPDVAVGTRVRITIPDSVRQVWGPRVQLLRGEVVAVAQDSLYMRLHGSPTPLAIPRAAIRRVERSLGVPGRAESALRGAVTWAFWGGLYIGLLRQSNSAASSAGPFLDDFAVGAAYGAATGLLFGAIYPTERWRRVRSP